MINIEKYYENTKEGLPHKNIQKFIKIKTETGNAIDLGCGTGRDTIFLIKNKTRLLLANAKKRLYLLKIGLYRRFYRMCYFLILIIMFTLYYILKFVHTYAIMCIVG